MSEMNEYTPDLYTLTDEDGNSQEFELLDVMELDDQRYFALVPYQPSPDELLDDSGELVILKSELDEETGEEMLISIDDDEEFDKVGEIFLKRIEEMFDDEDDEFDDENQD